jgi:16S rRNA (cytosine1402-N4)-methyltransferase
MEFSHKSVLLSESVEGLLLKAGGVYADCTTGGAGHSLKIASFPGIQKLVCIDQDEDAIKAAKERLAAFSDRVVFVRENFSHIKEILQDLKIEKADGLLYDLGVSSYQLDCAERGFSHSSDAVLDMRMAKDNPLTAKTVVNRYEPKELVRILREYGEEKYAKEIVSRIVRAREKQEIETTLELTSIIKSAIPPKVRWEGSHPAKRTFQAIRSR